MQIQASALTLGEVYRGSESWTVDWAAPDEVEVSDAKALVARMLYRMLTGREAPEVVRMGNVVEALAPWWG